MSQFGKVTGFKINIEKSNKSLYTRNTHVDTKIKNTLPFIIPQKVKEYGVSLTKHDKTWDSYTMLVIDSKDDVKKRRHIPGAQTADVNQHSRDSRSPQTEMQV